MDRAAFEDPFSPENFVEKLSRSSTQSKPDAFDPSPLIQVFESTISELYELNAAVAQDIVRLEEEVASKEKSVAMQTKDTSELCAEAQAALLELSQGMRNVSQKVVVMGDVLESKHQQRSRATSTVTIMKHFHAFTLPSPQPLLPPFAGDNPNLHECAEIIQKLHFIASQLPANKFADATAKIAEKHREIEKNLLAEFSAAADTKDTERMRACSHTLFPFDSYQKCLSQFIRAFITSREKELTPDALTSKAIPKFIDAIEETCVEAKQMIHEVFKYPQVVVVAFIQTIVKDVLGSFVQGFIMAAEDEYLDRLHLIYEQTKTLLQRLATRLSVSDAGTTFESNLLRMLFEDYLQSYVAMEEERLQTYYKRVCDEAFAMVKGHGSVRRKSLPTVKTTDPPARTKRGKKVPKNPGGNGSSVADTVDHKNTISPAEFVVQRDKFLSLDNVLTMIDENQRALKRCQSLVTAASLPDLSHRIFTTILQGLGTKYVQRALEIACSAVSGTVKAGSQFDLNLEFLGVVHDVNNIVYLLLKHFWDRVLPLVRSSVNVYQACVTEKNEVLGCIEALMSDGLAQSQKSVIAHCASILSKLQKKGDFSPPEDSMAFAESTCTDACRQCTQVLRRYADRLRECLNGKNLEVAFATLGTRVQAMLVAHVKHMAVNEMGAMLLIRDLNEYEKCVRRFQCAEADAMMVGLKEASSVLIVPADNLRALLDESRMSRVPVDLVHVFARLRHDFRTGNVAQIFSLEK
eukprot:m.651600 g.651600  ORF g.651600 m.651600 type:complete len:748 (-) comp22678_c0_seq2:501-2744(-)